MKNQLVIDWFSITVWEHEAISGGVIHNVNHILGFDAWQKFVRGSRGYRFRQNGLEGANLYTDVIDKQYGDHAHLELTGSACALVNWEVKLPELFQWLHINDIKYRITRLDIAIDHQQFEVSQVWEACQNGDIKTRVRRNNITRVTDVDNVGDTVYMGSKSSNTFIRIYKKAVENHPLFANNHFTRVETVYKDDRATYLFSILANLPVMEWLKTCRSTLNAYISVLTNWWAKWLESVNAGALLKLQQKPKSLSKTANWLHTQVAASLKMFVDAMATGDLTREYEVLQSILDIGAEKMTLKHQQILDYHYATVDLKDNYKSVLPSVEINETKSKENAAKSHETVLEKRDQYKNDMLVAWFNRLIETQFPEWKGKIRLFDASPQVVRVPVDPSEYQYQGKSHLDLPQYPKSPLPNDLKHEWAYTLDWDHIESIMMSGEPVPKFETPHQLMLWSSSEYDSIPQEGINHWDVD